MLFESNPLDTYGVSNGNGSVPSLFRGKIGGLHKCRWLIKDVSDCNSSIKKGGIRSQLNWLASPQTWFWRSNLCFATSGLTNKQEILEQEIIEISKKESYWWRCWNFNYNTSEDSTKIVGWIYITIGVLIGLNNDYPFGCTTKYIRKIIKGHGDCTFKVLQRKGKRSSSGQSPLVPIFLHVLNCYCSFCEPIVCWIVSLLILV
jgi:hypothetical protein